MSDRDAKDETRRERKDEEKKKEKKNIDEKR